MLIHEVARAAMEANDDGVELIAGPRSSPGDSFPDVASEATRLGYVPVIAEPAVSALPDDLLHRHLLIYVEDDGAGIAARWVRRLTTTSPRRHIVILTGTIVGEVERPAIRDRRVSARLKRAERWLRRGRPRHAERWLIAASAAARRWGDEALSDVVACEVIQQLLDHGRTAEARTQAGRMWARATELDWNAYVALAVVRSECLHAACSFLEARALVRGVLCEAHLRGRAVPDSLHARLAELDFWQARPRARPSWSLPECPDALGWEALNAWRCGNLEDLHASLDTLSARAAGGLRHEWWQRLAGVALHSTATGSRLIRLVEDCLGHAPPEVGPRLRALARVVAARVLLNAGRVAHARSVLEQAMPPGPESAAREAMLNRLNGDVALPRAGTPPGVLFLAGSDRMHLVDGLSSLLTLFQEASDEATALQGACRWLCDQGATQAAILSADGSDVAAAQHWRRADAGKEIAPILAELGRSQQTSADHGRFLVTPVRAAGAIIGHVICGLPEARRDTVIVAAQVVAMLGSSALRTRLDQLAATRRSRAPVSEIVGDSPLMAGIREAVARAAAAPYPVLIEGESGTGKELVARAVHRLSARRERRFTAINCAALTDELVEAELFGHTRGAFTGAIGQRTGLFEEAHGGSLFLDEVTELSGRAQAKLLRVLQEREIRRVGENTSRAIDVRVIAATNTPLAQAVSRGSFRNDLRFRLAVIRLQLPPLRDRPEDIPALAHLFWRRAVADSGTRAVLGADALTALVRHRWPGNVRELQNVMAGLAVSVPSAGRVTRRHVEGVLEQCDHVAEISGVRLESARRTVERRLIAAALARHDGRQAPAAAELGLTRQGLTKALRRLGLRADEPAAGVA